MKAKIYANNTDFLADENTCQIEIDLPPQCPCCNTAYASQPLNTVFSNSDPESVTAYSTFFCPTCGECFFCCYDVIETPIKNIGNLVSTFPHPKTETNFSSVIQTVSPNFIKIYNQAEKAQNQSLNEICGIGYRKALEFLIKDYVISLKPDEQHKIESMPLGKCISEYVDNEKIKTLSKVSTWIGNDETHYVRKHLNYNVQDLKRFINTVVAYIEYESNYFEALKFISDSD